MGLGDVGAGGFVGGGLSGSIDDTGEDGDGNTGDDTDVGTGDDGGGTD